MNEIFRKILESYFLNCYFLNFKAFENSVKKYFGMFCDIIMSADRLLISANNEKIAEYQVEFNKEGYLIKINNLNFE